MSALVLAALAVLFAGVSSETTRSPWAQNVRIGDFPTAPVTATSPPIALTHTMPPYTRQALLEGVEGTVTIEADFDIHGNPTILRVVRGLGYGLDENAIAALKDWRFQPAYQSGRPVQAVARIDVDFRWSHGGPITFEIGNHRVTWTQFDPEMFMRNQLSCPGDSSTELSISGERSVLVLACRPR